MKTSDLTLSIIILFIFLLLFIFNVLVVGIQRIKDNWPVYRCQPLIMPFASFFGHNTRENFGFCIQNLQKNFMGPLLKPLNFNISMLGDITGGLTSGLNFNRIAMSGFRFELNDIFMNIFSTMFNVMIEFQRTFINIKDVIGKLVGTMTTTLYIINGSIMTMQSSWDGPPGELVKALCFHPETKLQMQNGEISSMKDIPLNSILHNGTRVCAVMQISNLDENGYYIEKMYKVKAKRNDDDDIIVSGSHLIYDAKTEQFMHVKDLPVSELTDINCSILSCLITSDHTIPIGDWIFHDWEDSNGSAPKNIG